MWVKAKTSHIQRTWADVSSSTPHLQHKGLLVSPMKWRCLLRVLCPVRSPITTLDFVLLKNESLVLALKLGPEINSRARLWVLPRTRHLVHCWLSSQRRIFLRIFCLETPKDGWVQQSSERTHLLRAWRQFRFLVPQHVQNRHQNCPQQILVSCPLAGREILAARGLRGPYLCHIVSV